MTLPSMNKELHRGKAAGGVGLRGRPAGTACPEPPTPPPPAQRCPCLLLRSHTALLSPPVDVGGLLERLSRGLAVAQPLAARQVHKRHLPHEWCFGGDASLLRPSASRVPLKQSGARKMVQAQEIVQAKSPQERASRPGHLSVAGDPKLVVIGAGGGAVDIDCMKGRLQAAE
jgi:hypothetical protein